jgi:hypothetical protein
MVDYMENPSINGFGGTSIYGKPQIAHKPSINGGTLVPYFWPYFVGIFPYIGLKNRPYMW